MKQDFFFTGHWKRNLAYIWSKFSNIMHGNIIATENQRAIINDVTKIKIGVY